MGIVKCKEQLRAWAVWLTDRGKKIGSKPGQIDCLLSGKKEVLQGKLCKVSEIFGALAIDAFVET